jgi:hypothetical protein
MDLQPGDVVQIDPTHSNSYGGALAVVQRASHTGVTVILFVPSRGGPKREFTNCTLNQVKRIGKVAWRSADEIDDPAPGS